jgi:hypothetical protein
LNVNTTFFANNNVELFVICASRCGISNFSIAGVHCEIVNAFLIFIRCCWCWVNVRKKILFILSICFVFSPHSRLHLNLCSQVSHTKLLHHIFFRNENCTKINFQFRSSRKIRIIKKNKQREFCNFTMFQLSIYVVCLMKLNSNLDACSLIYELSKKTTSMALFAMTTKISNCRGKFMSRLEMIISREILYISRDTPPTE